MLRISEWTGWRTVKQEKQHFTSNLYPCIRIFEILCSFPVICHDLLANCLFASFVVQKSKNFRCLHFAHMFSCTYTHTRRIWSCCMPKQKYFSSCLVLCTSPAPRTNILAHIYFQPNLSESHHIFLVFLCKVFPSLSQFFCFWIVLVSHTSF